MISRISDAPSKVVDGRFEYHFTAAVETDGCLLDAVQYVIGATAGNGRRQWRVMDSLAVTVVGGDDSEAVRVELLPGAMREEVEVTNLHCTVGRDAGSSDASRDAAFDLLRQPLEDVATIEDVDGLPDWTR